MFSLVFSADLGEQGSTLTMPFLTSVSEAVFRKQEAPHKTPRSVARREREGGGRRRIKAKDLAKNSSAGHNQKFKYEAHPAI